MEILEKWIVPIMQMLFIFGIPVILVIIAIVVLCNIFFVPQFKTLKSKIKIENGVKVVDKRKEKFSNPSGIYTLYFITFEFQNKDKIELKTTQGVYNKANYNDVGIIKYRSEVELLKSFEITKKSGERTKGKSKDVGAFTRTTISDITHKKR